jgi:ubiquinone/menaquinone biosynthesis C-methylase UbiE
MDEVINYNSREYAHSTYLSTWFEWYLFQILQRYLQASKGEKVLEVGCNRGSVVKRLQELEVNAYGADINSAAVADGLTHNLFVMNAANLEFPDNSFDKAYSLHTIEHVPDTKKFLSEIERVLKPGGTLVLTYPIEPGFTRGFWCLYHAVFVYKNPLAARDIHIHSLHPKKLRGLIRDFGLNFEHQQSPFLVSFYPQYLTVLKKKG